MPTLKDERAAALKAAQDIVEGAKSGVRELTSEEKVAVKGHLDHADELDAKIKTADEDQALLKRLGDSGREVEAKGADQPDGPAATLGEHFLKSIGGADALARFKGVNGASLSAPEWTPGRKANTDPQITAGTGGVFGPYLTEVDPTIVIGNRPPAVVADLLGSGTISGQAITYFVEGALEGAFTTVAEAGAKPQLHNVNPTAVTDGLSKIAGFLKESDEMIEDLPFLVSAINGRLLYQLSIFEEQQILNGGGTGTDLKGILNRTGVLTESAADLDDDFDAIFRAMTKVFTTSGLKADGLVINPADYQVLRLQRDGNDQYLGGGPFQGQYGVGGILVEPPVWGLRTIVTPAIAVGTALVGSFKQAATLYRKGGVRVESTNSHASDFTSNLVTIRAEERVALAVRVPKAFCKVTLDES